MRATIKTWWRDWAAVDLLALGAGVAATFSYIDFRLRHPTVSSPYLEIWSNLAVGLLGAWLSVRLIDAMIQRRDRKHAVRRTLWGNLNHIRQLAERLLPDLYRWDMLALKNELMWAQERFPARKKHLATTETQKVSQVVGLLHELVQAAEKCIAIQSRADQHVNRIDAVLDELNTARDRINRQLDNLKYIGEGEAFQETEQLSRSLNQDLPSLSGSEIEQLHSLTARFTADSLVDTGEAVPMNRIRIGKIYRHELSWLAALERLQREFRDATDGRQQELLAELDLARARLAEQDLPARLKELATAYLDSVQDALSERLRLKLQVTNLISAIDSARHDISNESELD